MSSINSVTAILSAILAPVLIFAILVLVDSDARTIVSGSFKTKSVLAGSPTHASSIALFTTFILVLSKYLGFSPKLRQREDGSFLLPAIEVRAPLKVTSQDVETFYKSVLPLGKQRSARTLAASTESNPIYILAALTTPLFLQLLCKQASPVLPLGAVNVKNRFDFVDPEACRNLRTVQKNNKLGILSRMGGQDLLGKRMKRGMQFDIVIEVLASNKLIFRQTFTVLQMVKLKGPRPVDQPVTTSEKARVFDATEEQLAIDLEATSRYAASSKDYNPIHTSTLAAKVFGFPRRIAHGNLTAAMVIHSATNDTVGSTQSKASLGSLWNDSRKPSFITMEFKRPIPVPAKMQIKWAADGAQVVSKRAGEEKIHVDIQAGLA